MTFLAFLALAEASTCVLANTSAVVAERTEVLVTTPSGTSVYSWSSLKAAAIACGYSDTLHLIDERDKAIAWGNIACGVGVCVLWPVGIAAPVYWVRASQLRESLGPTLIRESTHV